MMFLAIVESGWVMESISSVFQYTILFLISVLSLSLVIALSSLAWVATRAGIADYKSWARHPYYLTIWGPRRATHNWLNIAIPVAIFSVPALLLAAVCLNVMLGLWQ